MVHPDQHPHITQPSQSLPNTLHWIITQSHFHWLTFTSFPACLLYLVNEKHFFLQQRCDNFALCPFCVLCHIWRCIEMLRNGRRWIRGADKGLIRPKRKSTTGRNQSCNRAKIRHFAHDTTLRHWVWFFFALQWWFGLDVLKKGDNNKNTHSFSLTHTHRRPTSISLYSKHFQGQRSAPKQHRSAPTSVCAAWQLQFSLSQRAIAPWLGRRWRVIPLSLLRPHPRWPFTSPALTQAAQQPINEPVLCNDSGRSLKGLVHI